MRILIHTCIQIFTWLHTQVRKGEDLQALSASRERQLTQRVEALTQHNSLLQMQVSCCVSGHIYIYIYIIYIHTYIHVYIMGAWEEFLFHTSRELRRNAKK
jgi:hypothetical protein